ncbi:MAG: hypothetical protein ACYCQJ_03670 [Nitrososphaerales archaeon]
MKFTFDKKILAGSLVLAVILGSLLFIGLIAFAPDSTSYSQNNYGWNGLHDVSAKYSIQSVSSLSQIPISNNSVLLEVAPAIQFSASSAQVVRNLAVAGSSVFIMDSTGTSNSLLSYLGTGIQIAGNSVNDPIYNWKSNNLPLALVQSPGGSEYSFLSGVKGLALDEPSSLIVSGAETLATSSPQSVLGNSSQRGPFDLLASKSIGNGMILVMGDSNFLTDSVWSNADNQILIQNLFANRTVYLDTSHWPLNTQTSIKSQILSILPLLSSFPYEYLVTIAFVVIAILFVPVVRGLYSLDKGVRVTRQVSRFNNASLKRVEEERAKHGIQSD